MESYWPLSPRDTLFLKSIHKQIYISLKMFVKLFFRQTRLWINNLKYGMRLVHVAFQFADQNTCVYPALVRRARFSLLPKTPLLGLVAICATQDDIFSAIAAKKYRYVEKLGFVWDTP
ncbi:hypothetical protein PHET_10193 [Paragonimus heterotremus]|uniref:Uncharacterized protein n=1 Tax=Paragonimus heterotremus TaxID=100268 RepID=A0A8J4T2A8_9TREM|nr:hypothetical protein PHET_10193 [Paragonimus heterotremus]